MNYKIKFIIYSVVISVAFMSFTVSVFASNASLFITTPNVNLQEGDTTTISIKVKSPNESINAVSGSIYFSPDALQFVSISKSNSIVNLWTHEPTLQRNKISFEGIILNPGFQGSSGEIFDVTFEALKQGSATINFSDGSVLANDGLGTNILNSLEPTTLAISPAIVPPGKVLALIPIKPIILPVITDYSSSILSKNSIYIKGTGEPDALTKLAFADTSVRSIGEQFLDYIQTKKKTLTDTLVQNDSAGVFQYTSDTNLLAGAYDATPILVDPNTSTEQSGLGVKILVSDSKIVHYIVILLNVLALLVPVSALVVLIYFIPWYSLRRMRVIKKKLGLEEEKIEISENELKREDKVLDEKAGK